MNIMPKLLLLLVLLALVGCSDLSGSASTSVAPEPPTQVAGAPAGPPGARTSAPAAPTPTAAARASPAAAPDTTAAPEATTITPATPAPSLAPASPIPPAYSYPIGTPGKPLGDGFFIRHGVQVENTWYNPGYWHTGEDWYAIEGDTAGAHVYAVADGEVACAGRTTQAASDEGCDLCDRARSPVYAMHMVTRLSARLSWCKDSADLLQQAEEVRVDPRYHNLAVHDAEDVDPRRCIARQRNAQYDREP